MINDEVIKELETKIATTKSELKNYKFLLRQMKQSQAVPFAQTKIGKAWFKSLATMTKPFAKWHQTANNYVTDPISMWTQAYLEQARNLLFKVSNLSPQDESIHMHVQAMAQLVIEMENHIEKYPNQAEICDNHIKWLRAEIENLRDVEHNISLKDQLDRVIKGLEAQKEQSEVK